MKDSIFSSELPIVQTDKELNEIKDKFSEYDSYYITSGCVEERRNKFNKLWLKFKPYADRHFLKEAKVQFHQRSWEMYLGNVFLNKKLEIKSDNYGPDFLVNNEIYVECVAPRKGDFTKVYSVPEIIYAKKIEEVIVLDVPSEQIVLRITNAINNKVLKYKSWENKRWFNKKYSFVLAINTGDFLYPQFYGDIPIIINALFGFSHFAIDKDKGCNTVWRNTINKGEGVSVSCFTNTDLSFVSGVIFSDKAVLNHPDEIGGDCIFVNNPFACHPVPNYFSSLFKSWAAHKDVNGIIFNKLY